MKPLDRRLLTYARAARTYIVFITVTGTLLAVLVIAQAMAIAGAITPVITENKTLSQVRTPVLALVTIMVMRAILTYINRAYAHRAANNAIIELRQAVLDRATQLGPRWLAHKSADTVTLVTRGLDDLGPYFVAYLPQLLMTLTVTPLALLVMLYLDWSSALIAILTIPLIPIFMILVGKLTQEYADQKLKTMEKLGSQLLDLIAGLPTLKALGREWAPASHVHRLGRTHARTTMQTLRVAFLSGAILEFIATLSVALVAVKVGMLLVYDYVELFPALVVIMLAPEVYLPLREVGKNFHASADGVAAAEAAFEILEEPVRHEGEAEAPDLTQAEVVLNDLSVAARGTWAPAHLSARITPGSITALVGPSGAGKTTTVMALLGLLSPTRGSIAVTGTDGRPVDLSTLSRDSWWSQITWVPQAPAILPATVRENVCEEVTYSQQQLDDAARATGFDSVVADLPQGWDTFIGHGGVGLSVGQRQRLALTRALLVDKPWIILDEPTAHLDAVTESQILTTIDTLHTYGRTLIIIAHRAVVIERATHVITVEAAAASDADIEQYPQLSETTVEQLRLQATPRLLEGEIA
ncbi:MAG: thiol reductant ABC exporter subunit CydD [Actinomycetaceae bacterium]|nr:thiol reductant ABC exporter subunit CydD [Actinomycetaceae bacterium]